MAHHPLTLEAALQNPKASRPPVYVLWETAWLRDTILRSDLVDYLWTKQESSESVGAGDLYRFARRLDAWLETYDLGIMDITAASPLYYAMQLWGDGPKVRAFIWGFGSAFLFFLPEILRGS